MHINSGLIKEVIKETSFSLLLIGVILIVIAGVKNIGDYSIIDNNWRIFIAAIGTIILITGLIITFRENSQNSNLNIKIIKPLNEEKIKGDENRLSVLISGTYKQELPDCYLFVQHVETDYVWPQCKISYNRYNKTWDGNIGIGGEPTQQCYIFVAKVGIEGQKQIKAHNENAEKLKQWKSFVPASDIEKLDKIIIYQV